MVTKRVTKKGHEYESGSPNIFADLDVTDSDEKLMRAMLAVRIYKILSKRKIKTQKEIAELLCIDKSEVSKLMNADFNRFSQERLIGFLNKLNYKVTMQIAPMRKGDSPQDVIML